MRPYTTDEGQNMGVDIDRRPRCERCGCVKYLRHCSICDGEIEDVGRPPIFPNDDSSHGVDVGSNYSGHPGV